MVWIGWGSSALESVFKNRLTTRSDDADLASVLAEIDVITAIKHTHKCAVMGFYHRKEVSRVRCSSDQVWKELSDSLVTLC